MINTLGAERAMKAWDITPTKKAAERWTGLTVSQWVDKHIN